MTLFVRLVATDKANIIKTALSPEVPRPLQHKSPTPVNARAVEILLDHLLKHDDLWYDDALGLHPDAHGAFFALKTAFQAMNLVTYSVPETMVEEEHIINALKKRGYWPWY
jgi:hypothetical protein